MKEKLVLTDLRGASNTTVVAIILKLVCRNRGVGTKTGTHSDRMLT